MTGSPIRVLFVSSVTGIGGAEASLIELASHLDRDHFKVELLTEGHGLLAAQFSQLGIPVHIGAFPFFSRRRPWVYVRALKEIVSTLRARHIDLVHVNCDRAIPHVIRSTKLVGTPVLCHIHDLTRAWYRKTYVAHLNRSHRIVADSKAVFEACQEAGMRPDLLQVIYECFVMKDFLDVPDASRWTVRYEWGVESDTPLIGLVGHLDENKGHETLLQAAPRIAECAPNVRFVFVGDDSLSGDRLYRHRLDRMIDELDLASRVHFAGRREDIPSVMKALDLLVVPSRSEAFGRVVVEALSVGLPVVANRVGGIPEIIRDGLTGILVEPGDIDGFSSAVIRMLEDSELKRQVKSLGPITAERFDVGPHVELFGRTYDAILSGTTSTLPTYPFSDD